jgi:hypothetical protein
MITPLIALVLSSSPVQAKVVAPVIVSCHVPGAKPINLRAESVRVGEGEVHSADAPSMVMGQVNTKNAETAMRKYFHENYPGHSVCKSNGKVDRPLKLPRKLRAALYFCTGETKGSFSVREMSDLDAQSRLLKDCPDEGATHCACKIGI